MVELSKADRDAIIQSVEAGIIKKLHEPDGPLIVAVDVTAAKLAKEPKRDPYRSILQFLTGLLAFCLTLLVALFAAIGSDKASHAVTTLVSWVLMGMAVTAVIGTVAIFLVQLSKAFFPDKFGWPAWFGVAASVGAVIVGGVTVLYCVRGGMVVVEQHCVAKPMDGIGEPALFDFFNKQKEDWRNYTHAVAMARMRDCIATGDLASGAAWARIAGALAPKASTQ